MQHMKALSPKLADFLILVWVSWKTENSAVLVANLIIIAQDILLITALAAPSIIYSFYQ